jgi:cell wall assembly regulator SMI1
MATLDEIFEELMKFSSRVLSIKEGVSQEKIQEFELAHNFALPNDYKDFLKRTNGVSLMGAVIYGIHDDSVSLSLGGAFQFEHFEVENEMPMHFIPFAPDGGGNHYCFDISRCSPSSCTVIFWQHDLTYTDDFLPEEVSDSFVDWAKEVLIDWKLEDNDYEGNDRGTT